MNDIYISLDDLKAIFQRKKRKILRLFFSGAAVCLLYTLFTPASYEAVATFQQATPQQSGFDWKMFMRNFSNPSSESSTIPIMLSQTVLGKTVEELGLQATLKEANFWMGKWLALRSHFSSQERSQPVFQNVVYNGPKPKHLSLTLKPDGLYEIKDQSQTIQGTIGTPIQLSCLSLTLAKLPPSFEIGKPYLLTILPKRSVIEALKTKISIKPLREDKNVLVIKFCDPHRELSASLVNTLLLKYEEFLVTQNKTIIESQLHYLDQRQEELSHKLDLDLNEHIGVLKKSLQEQGFMGVEQELESILEPIKLHRERLNAIEVELAGLKKRISEGTPSSDKLTHRFQENLNAQINAATTTLEHLEKGSSIPSHPPFAALIQDIEKAKDLWQTSQDEAHRQSYFNKKDQLAAHLRLLIQHLMSRQTNFVVNNNYIDHLETDFLGMTLESAKNLFQQYCHQLDQLHAQIKQIVFFRDHLHEPHFEISTLTNVLGDSVTEHLVRQSSQIEEALFDSANHTTKEQERLKATLITNKRFLQSHLTQTVELGKIRIGLIQEKIGSLYTVIRDLLKNEKEVLEAKINDLKESLAAIPDLLQMEKRLDFKTQLTKGMMEGLTQIIESKNLSRHLYQVQSKPIDSAADPIEPLSPHFFLKSIGVGACVSLLYYLFLLIQALVHGLPLSLATLRLMGAHTAGDLNPTSNLETLRSGASFLIERKTAQGTIVAILGEKGTSFISQLAKLLSLQGTKIGIIDCNLDRIVEPGEKPGLWHYLTQSSSSPQFQQNEHFDFLPASGTTLHGVEHLLSHRFTNLLSQCRSQYDFIFLLKQSPLATQDALQLLSLSDLAVVAVAQESQKTLQLYLDWSRQKEKDGATFVKYPLAIE